MLRPFMLNDYDIHGTFVSYHNQGLLFLGQSGTGKSLLAYQLIADGAQLIADDIVHINTQNIGSAHQKNRGLIEVYGLGVIRLNPHQYKISAPITHIFFSGAHIERVYASQYFNLNEKPISYSRYNFGHYFAPSYIKLFCAMLNGDIAIKNSL
ncbi:MAG: HPr kinase/phosphorylase [Alphaproteobacteria bacterium]